MSLARLPAPPYYAVIFSSRRTQGDQGYAAMAAHMDRLAAEQPGFLGTESARDAEGFGITVSYWRSLAAIAAWRENVEHRLAQELGRAAWYEAYRVRIARVEHAHDWTAGDAPCAAAGHAPAAPALRRRGPQEA